ncbi:MAG: hypothetical protein Q4A75_02365 [Peptostreptococcaceae bacterium]|nr:hypothetical protein [Peptostreptococcaceae bacterium]
MGNNALRKKTALQVKKVKLLKRHTGTTALTTKEACVKLSGINRNSARSAIKSLKEKFSRRDIASVTPSEKKVFFDELPKSERERLLAEHTRRIIKEAHEKGLSTYHCDGKTHYWLRPDGTKVVDKVVE